MIHLLLLIALGQPPLCLADVTHDAMVDQNDLMTFLHDFEIGNLNADINRDGGITIEDLLLFIEHYEAGC